MYNLLSVCTAYLLAHVQNAVVGSKPFLGWHVLQAGVCYEGPIPAGSVGMACCRAHLSAHGIEAPGAYPTDTQSEPRPGDTTDCWHDNPVFPKKYMSLISCAQVTSLTSCFPKVCMKLCGKGCFTQWHRIPCHFLRPVSWLQKSLTFPLFSMSFMKKFAKLPSTYSLCPQNIQYNTI